MTDSTAATSATERTVAPDPEPLSVPPLVVMGDGITCSIHGHCD
ncbi:hypothetical protein AB0N24_23200 [Arthrobacter sp. NPDC093128]